MNNTPVVAHTKGGELLKFKRQLRETGWAHVPSVIIRPPFEGRIPLIESLQRRFVGITTPDGPFLPYLMVRNNGRPEGTGEGRSEAFHIELPSRELAGWMEDIRSSDPMAQGVLVQPVVGQLIYTDYHEYGYGKCFGPIISGIAYTARATERGNAVIEIVVGHPSKAVQGEGAYVAFNAATSMDDVKLMVETGWHGIDMDLIFLTDAKAHFGRDVKVRRTDGLFEYLMEDGKLRTKIKELVLKRTDMLKLLAEAVLKLGELGPFYLEWAMTHIRGQTRLFCLQISEFEGKMAGLPTEMQRALARFDGNLEKAERAGSRDLEGLKVLYRAAIEDPRVISAGFDVVGMGRKEFGTMLWKPESDDFAGRFEEPVLVATGKGPITKFVVNRHADTVTNVLFWKDFNIGGLVELETPDKRIHRTFRAHTHGFCSVRSILGLGGAEKMEDKLYAMFPSDYHGPKSRLVIKGKFVLDVDESRPFGTLRVERVDKVISLEEDF